MPDITVADIGAAIIKLRHALPSKDKRPAAIVADIWREALAGVSAAGLEHAVRSVIRDEVFFPKVAQLRQLASEFDRSHYVHSPAQIELDICPVCRQNFYPRVHYVPRMAFNDRGQRHPVLTDDGAHVLLDRVQRIVCFCSTRSHWQPVPDIEPECAPIAMLHQYHAARVRYAPKPRSSEAVA